jgi:hypothetical protein
MRHRPSSRISSTSISQKALGVPVRRSVRASIEGAPVTRVVLPRAVLALIVHCPAVGEHLPFGFHEGKAGRHRAEFVLGEFVGVVAHCSSPEALAFNKRNFPSAYWRSVTPAAFAISNSAGDKRTEEGDGSR